jgi:hypothetical protein
MWVCLFAAVLWAQSLGLVHQALHAPGLQASANQALVSEEAQHSNTSDNAGTWSHLWGSGQTAECLSYDQLAQGVTFTPPVVIAQLAPPAWQARPLALDARRVNPALFDARGPPVFL